ncbi:hypothetical protein [Embleya sp. AB8]|uniref:hypothetical protein n=1 Tax=Embleya sp. AB8 TaxID=3156304 RepID=UPI003C761827
MSNPRLELATCTFQEFASTMGAPIRTTAGAPRWTLGYQLGGHARSITPPRNLLSAELPQDAYEFTYRRFLNTTGVDTIRAELESLAVANASQPLVLLCFDRLNQPNGWCHRTMFAAWWTEQTGDQIPELGAQMPTYQPQMSLFDTE